MPTWNPHTPDTFGLEWLAHSTGVHSVSSAGSGLAIDITATTTDDIDRIATWVAGFGEGSFIVEVYPAGTEVLTPEDVSYIDWYPNEDDENQDNNWETIPGGVTTNLWSVLDDGSYADAITYGDPLNPGSVIPMYLANFATTTGGFPVGLTSTDRIVGGRVLGRVAVDVAGGHPCVALYRNYSTMGGYHANLENRWVPQIASPFTVEFEFGEQNPAHLGPWTLADAYALDSVDGIGLAFWRTNRAANQHPNIYELQLRFYVAPEERVAFGMLSPYVTAPPSPRDDVLPPTTGLRHARLREPDGTDDWAMIPGDYTVVIRRLGDKGGAGIYYTDASPLSEAPFAITAREVRTYVPQFAQPIIHGGWGIITETLRTFPWIPTLLVIDDTDVAEPVSSPYAHTVDTPVWGTAEVQQEVTAPATESISTLRFLLRAGTATVLPLDVTVRRRSDNVLMGSAGQVTVDQWRAERIVADGWRVVDVELATTADLVSGTQYYVEAVCAGAGDPAGGWVLSLLTHPPSAGSSTTAQGFGGTTDQATVDGVETADLDWPVTLHAAIDVPDDFAAEVVSEPLPHFAAGIGACGGECFVSQVERVDVTWSSTSQGANFARYDVQRSTDDGATWSGIASITTESVELFRDYEAPLGRPARYRMRVVRTDGGRSPWTSVLTVTCQPAGREVLFVSNERPSLNCGYLADAGVDGTTDYEFLSGPATTFTPVHGRDFQLATSPLEWLGERLPMRVHVNVPGRAPAATGRRMFAALEAIGNQATLSYVAVKSWDGDVWMAQVQVMGAQRRARQQIHTCDLVITEVTDTPSTPDVEPL